MKKKDEIRFNAWSEHLKNTKELTSYSIKRMDLLIVSISGAGIYIIFETLREFKTGNIDIDNPKLLLLSGISFLLAITLNFISQWTGYMANSFEEEYIRIELRKIEKEEDNEDCDQKRYDKKVQNFNKLTDILNALSILSMFTGLILLAIFNFKLF
ncbi:MAG: hypothetical protein KDC69_09200 [Flavobacteriaceae bacterium]|nr:hypothetical protein [Flavobacteriaceae bacterium]MCB0747473.1 hypothetical protein [Ignavibacteriota bacterium]